MNEHVVKEEFMRVIKRCIHNQHLTEKMSVDKSFSVSDKEDLHLAWIKEQARLSVLLYLYERILYEELDIDALEKEMQNEQN